MFKVVFEDDAILVIDKDPGVVVTSSETQKEPSLEDYLRETLNIQAERGGVVHRLDKDTSGLLVIGKSDEIVAKLQSQFKKRSVKKEYLALTHGFLEEEKLVDAPIARNPGDREKFMVDGEREEDNLREAVTIFAPFKKLKMEDETLSKVFSDFNKVQRRKIENMKYQEFGLIKCYPQTGRTHQIRVHLKYINHPIVGDNKYGGKKVTRLDKRWCPRQFLHAENLEFTHPQTLERLKFFSPLPKDLETSLSYLRVLN